MAKPLSTDGARNAIDACCATMTLDGDKLVGRLGEGLATLAPMLKARGMPAPLKLKLLITRYWQFF